MEDKSPKNKKPQSKKVKKVETQTTLAPIRSKAKNSPRKAPDPKQIKELGTSKEELRDALDDLVEIMEEEDSSNIDEDFSNVNVDSSNVNVNHHTSTYKRANTFTKGSIPNPNGRPKGSTRVYKEFLNKADRDEFGNDAKKALEYALRTALTRTELMAIAKDLLPYQSPKLTTNAGDTNKEVKLVIDSSWLSSQQVKDLTNTDKE